MFYGKQPTTMEPVCMIEFALSDEAGAYEFTLANNGLFVCYQVYSLID